jgi:hypothetical protein
MKTPVEYDFDASAKTITFPDYAGPGVRLDRILLVDNVTRGILLYNFANPALGGAVAGNVLTLEYDTTAQDDADDLIIFYEDPASSPATAENQADEITALGLLDTDLDTLHTDNGVIEGKLDTLHADFGVLEAYVDGLEGYTDGLETAVASTNTKLDTLHTDLGTLGGYVDGLEGFTDGLETKLDTLHTDNTTIEGKQDTGNASLASIDGKTPALGQALAAASVPVILPSATITTLTPQTNALTDTQLRATAVPVRNTLLETWAAAVGFTISLNALASSVAKVGRQATMLTGNISKKALVTCKFKMGTTPTINTTVDVYLIQSDGTNATDSAGASDAGITLANAILLGQVLCTATTTGAIYIATFDTETVAPSLGPNWTIAVVNGTGAALDAVAGGTITYQLRS